jgi:hypothetical protein
MALGVLSVMVFVLWSNTLAPRRLAAADVVSRRSAPTGAARGRSVRSVMPAPHLSAFHNLPCSGPGLGQRENRSALCWPCRVPTGKPPGMPYPPAPVSIRAVVAVTVTPGPVAVLGSASRPCTFLKIVLNTSASISIAFFAKSPVRNAKA